MGLFNDLFQKFGKKGSFAIKEKCDFCDEPFHKRPIKVISFEFTGDIQYQCCQRCFNKASKNDMRITSPKIVKDYIAKEQIECATDPRLKNFFGSLIYVDGLWVTINNFLFFGSSEIGLPFNSDNGASSLSSLNNSNNSGDDNSSFWTSFIVADLTHSPIAGYLVGGSFMGALLGSNVSSSTDSFSSFNSSDNSSSSSNRDDSFSQSSWGSDSSSSCSTWGDSGSDSSYSDSGSSCGGGD